MINHDIKPACRTILNRLEAFLDDEISGGERAEIAWHLSECASCRAEMRLLAVISNAIRGRSRPVGSERIRARLLEEVNGGAGAVSRSRQQARTIVYEMGGAKIERFESSTLIRYHSASTVPRRQGVYHRTEFREAAPGGRRITRTVQTG